MLTYDRLCAEIISQTELLAADIKDADLSTPVPSCPGWTVNQVLRHLGFGQRWAASVVATGTPQPDAEMRELSAHRDGDPVVLGPWLTEGAALLADTLRAAGPDATLWTPVPAMTTAAFWARRYAHETLMHRCDATLALGKPFSADEDVVVDALDEWMWLLSNPEWIKQSADKMELLGPGRTVHLHATDADAEWVIDLSGDAIVCRPAHEKSAVAVRGPVTDLLLVLYRRRKPGTVFGDTELLDFVLSRIGFG